MSSTAEANMSRHSNPYDEFILVHHLQLQNSCVPQLYWKTLFNKLKDEVFDAGNAFQIQLVEHEEEGEENDEPSPRSWRVVVNCEGRIKSMDEKHIYLIDHAWTYRQHEARQYLTQVPSLKDRMCLLMDIDRDGREEEVIDEILQEMWRFNNTYSIGNFELGTNERLPLWYIMDEFGSRIQHSDMPTFKMAPFLYGPQQTAFSIIWPVRDLENGEEVTRDFIPNIQHPERRKAMLLPWIHHDLRETSYQQPEPKDDFFSAHRIMETVPEKVGPVPPLPCDRKVRVCLDYPKAPELTDPRFEMVDTGEEADIIWTRQSFKDYSSLCSDGKFRYINQFPSEQCITVKDLLPVICRRAGTNGINSETLEGSPRWLPVSYNLNTELDKFVSYFQHREDKGLDNVWILKPWNLSNSADVTVTNNLNQILRVTESGPKIACKYVSDCVTIHRADIASDVKVDFRFLTFLASVNPLKLYVYKPFSVRRGHKQYALTDFDDLLRHLTYVGLYEFNVYRPGMYTEQFIEPFEAENPDIKWSTVEESIHRALLEMFQAASSKPPPAGLGDFPLSRAIYGIDLLLKWDKNEKGERFVQPIISEVNFACDYTSWMEEYPEMLNDAFSVLFYEDLQGREERVKVLAS